MGKTFLIRETFGYKFTFQHTGLAKGNTKDQLFSFAISLRDAEYDDCPIPKSWLEAFSMLSHFLKNSTDENNVGAQIDLLIDRNDKVINLCEMKFSLPEFYIDAEYERNLRNKKSAFIASTNTRKAVHLTMVTTYGVHKNVHSGIIQNEITLDELFI